MPSNLDLFVHAQGEARRKRVGLVFYASVLLVLGLMVSLSSWSIYRDYRLSLTQVQQNISALSRSLEGYISALLLQSYDSVYVVAEDLNHSSTRNEDATIRAALAQAMRYDPVSAYLFYQPTEGRMLAVDSRGQNADEALMAMAASLPLATSEQPVFGRAVRMGAGGEFFLPLLIGQRDGEGRTHTIGALIRTDRMGTLLKSIGLEAQMSAGMFDNNGTVLYRTPDPEHFAGSQLTANSPLRPRIGRHDFDVVDGFGVDGQRALFADSPSATFPIHAVVAQTFQRFQGPWLRRTASSAALLMLSLIAIGLAALQLRRLISEISESGHFYRKLFTDINDGVLLIGADGRIRAANRRAAHMFGVDGPPQLHMELPSGLSPVHQPDGRLSLEVSRGVLSNLLAGNLQELESEWQFQRRDNGQPFDCEVRASLFRWEHNTMVLVVLHDVTERKRYLAEQEYLASHDPLTNLPNRYWLVRHIQQRIARAPQQRFAVLLLDMNRFKEVNDTLGHHHGDAVLQQLGQRLGGWLHTQGAEIARLGGDEMAVVSSSLLDEAAVADLCQGIGQVLRQPLSAGGILLELSASIGVACYPENGDNHSDLLRCADIAMYQAKNSQRHYRLYQRGDDNYTPERLALHTSLGRAIREGGLLLHYQPKVQLSDGRVMGFEALLRWEHPERGLIPPQEFIPLAESTELIHPLTYWVLDEALRQVRAWAEQGLDTCMAVNISANNLRNPHFVSELQALLEAHQVPAAQLELEVTEGTLLEDPEMALRSLQAIRDLGVALSIDDFGTGYSSLAYLKRLPVQVLKIDRTFVSAMVENFSDAMIVQSTIALGHNFGMQVVAEGVEDEATATALQRLGCDIAQGYHFGRPMTAEQVVTWRLQRQLASLALD
ncbi:MAG: putative signaling protein [Stenotrophomonas maltophilia]|nr:MAG: putative signaling protein [Stenotrophomonas maltophilia]